MEFFPARLSASIQESLVDIFKDTKQGVAGVEGKRVGLPSLHPLNPPGVATTLRVRSSELLQAQKDLGSTLFFLFTSDVTGYEPLRPISRPRPRPDCLKLALFLPIAPFFLFFNLPHKEVGSRGEGRIGEEEGVGGCQVSYPWLSFLKRRAATQCESWDGRL